MKTEIKSVIAITLLLVCTSSVSQASSDTTLSVNERNTEQGSIESSISRKYSPEVNLEKVQEIFGHNLDTGDTTLKMLLLAIGMDHTTNESPNYNSSIGIPFIVDRGPGHWVERLNAGDYKIEVLMNNALLLLFTKEEIPEAKESAFYLIEAAADRGYWPANFYVAESNLSKYLSLDFSKASPLSGEMKSSAVKAIALDTMNRYNQCAEMSFAPCQYRIGFWLVNSQKSLNEGLNILRQAIKTTINDTRYKAVLDGAILMAAKEVVFKGEQAGLDYVVREEYTKLIQQQLSTLTNEVEQLNESQSN